MRYNYKKVKENLLRANKNLAKLNNENYQIGYEEKNIWYPILRSKQFPVVTSKIRVKDLPQIPFTKIDDPIYIDGGNIDEL